MFITLNVVGVFTPGRGEDMFPNPICFGVNAKEIVCYFENYENKRNVMLTNTYSLIVSETIQQIKERLMN